MGVDCYCYNNTDPGSIPVPSLDKPVTVSNNLKKYNDLQHQETYNRVLTVNKNDLKSVQSSKKENENDKDNNNIIYNIISNNNNNIIIQNDSEFDKYINSFFKKMTEEQFNSLIKGRIKEIQLKFGEIKQDKKNEYINKFSENIIFKSPLFKEETNVSYFGSWDYINLVKKGWGTLIDKEGNFYEGGWEKDSINGYGRIISKNGDYYEGEIKNGNLEGNGIYYSYERKSTYKGEFHNNCFEGKGEQIFENYDNKNKKIIYEGEFKKGKRNGKGKLIFDDENIYEGSFNNDNFDGDGCFKWKDGREYKGQWKDNNMNGKGIFKWDTNNWYEGDYKNNRREGYGVYHFGEDNYFDGKWLNNLPHGMGKLKINGEKVEGLFRFGKMIKNNKKGNTFIGNIANIDFKDENIGAKAFKRKINSLK
jgi:hypothetical protein